MITEDYVSFETAKLLKEKGFNEDSWFHYDADGDIVTRGYRLNMPEDIPAWTLQMAMKWLREVYNLFISISIWLRHKDGTVQYYYEIRNLNNKDFETIAGTTIAEFDSPEKTYEAAIMCCLKNLI